MKILYVDSIEKLDYNYLPIYKKCDNGKYLQLCSTQLSEEILNEKADPTELISAIDGFSNVAFNALSKKLNVKFVVVDIHTDKDKFIKEEKEKKLVIERFNRFQNY